MIIIPRSTMMMNMQERVCAVLMSRASALVCRRYHSHTDTRRSPLFLLKDDSMTITIDDDDGDDVLLIMLLLFYRYFLLLLLALLLDDDDYASLLIVSYVHIP